MATEDVHSHSVGTEARKAVPALPPNLAKNSPGHQTLRHGWLCVRTFLIEWTMDHSPITARHHSAQGPESAQQAQKAVRRHEGECVLLQVGPSAHKSSSEANVILYPAAGSVTERYRERRRFGRRGTDIEGGSSRRSIPDRICKWAVGGENLMNYTIPYPQDYPYYPQAPPLTDVPWLRCPPQLHNLLPTLQP